MKWRSTGEFVSLAEIHAMTMIDAINKLLGNIDVELKACSLKSEQDKKALKFVIPLFLLSVLFKRN